MVACVLGSVVVAVVSVRDRVLLLWVVAAAAVVV
jgi:hypothetical protein